MKSFKGFLALAGITALVLTANAQNPAYSSKAALLKPAVPAAIPAPVVEVAQISTKPWLYAGSVTPKAAPGLANVDQKNMAVVNYNSKTAVRGQGPVEFELAPLK